jgi:hypothetical protein
MDECHMVYNFVYSLQIPISRQSTLFYRIGVRSQGATNVANVFTMTWIVDMVFDVELVVIRLNMLPVDFMPFLLKFGFFLYRERGAMMVSWSH